MELASDRKKIVVVGGGLTGLVSALTLARASSSHHEVVLVAPQAEFADKRTTAILLPAVRLLRSLGAWGDLAAISAALKTMRIVDSGNRLIAAPTVEFKSSEVEAEAFGYNVPNEAAAKLLRSAIELTDKVVIIEAKAQHLNASERILTLDDGERIKADLFVAADGKDSLLRREAGIATRVWSYPQTALVTGFSHSLPHHDVSTELHTRTGPFTQVPLPPTEKSKYRSSLVWVVRPQEAQELLNSSHATLSSSIEGKLQSSLGKVTIETDLQAFPLSGMTAQRFATNGVILVGEAAHVMPPIGAQGFNLGVNDIKTIADVLSKGFSKTTICKEYDRKRRAEIITKTGGIDLLNRSLLTAFLPLHLGRSFALGALSDSRFLRRTLMSGIMDGPTALLRSKEQRPNA